MIQDIKVARDTQGVRIYLEPALFNDLSGLAPFSCLDCGDEIVVAPDKAGRCHAISMCDERCLLGFRFSHAPKFKGLFAPHATEAEISDDGWMVIKLPDLHELPWPRLARDAEHYIHGEVALQVVAERLHSLMAATGSGLEEAFRTLRIPDSYRQAIGHDGWASWVKGIRNATGNSTDNHAVGLRDVR